MLSNKQWSEEQWGSCELGDRRRTLRALELGACMARLPNSSLPQQTEDWKGLKGAYRLLQSDAVSHENLQVNHWASTQATVQQCVQQGQTVLLVQDTTLLDYSRHPQTGGLGQIGADGGHGLVVHSCLAISGEDATDKSSIPILGMVNQRAWARLPKEEQDPEAEKESEKWIKAVQSVECGEPGHLVSVGDRESDVFSYLRKSQEQGIDCLIRVCQNRVVTAVEGAQERVHLKDWARTLEPMTSRKISLRSRGSSRAREVVLSIAWHECTLMPPQNSSDQGAGISGWCIRCWEASPAEGDPSPLEWILFCTIPVTSAVMARRVLGWYERRWMIEEYHKCLKSGCRIESSQLQDGDSLQRLLGFLGLIAVRLLQLRMWSQHHPGGRANKVIPALEVRIVAKHLGISDGQLTIRRFYRAVASWGGFIGRRSDGEPGWQTLWRGWTRLQDMAWALKLTRYRP